MWLLLLHHSLLVLIIIKVGLEKSKVYPNKCIVSQEQTLRETLVYYICITFFSGIFLYYIDIDCYNMD